MSNSRNDKHLLEFVSASGRAFDQLVRAVTATGKDAIPCAECRRYFPALLELEKHREEISEDDSHAVHHLMHCPYCAEEFNMLREAMTEFERGTLPELDVQPQFDLSFMEPASDRIMLWTADVTNRVRSLFTDVRVVVKGSTASFGSLLAPLTPKPAAIGAFRSVESETPVEVLVLPASDANLSVRLSVGPVTDGNAVIAVKLLEMETAAPLPDTRVTLRNAHRQLLVGSMTGQDGSTVFEHLAIGRYFIQVRHKEQSWEIPVVVIAGNHTTSSDASEP